METSEPRVGAPSLAREASVQGCDVEHPGATSHHGRICEGTGIARVSRLMDERSDRSNLSAPSRGHGRRRATGQAPTTKGRRGSDPSPRRRIPSESEAPQLAAETIRRVGTRGRPVRQSPVRFRPAPAPKTPRSRSDCAAGELNKRAVSAPSGYMAVRFGFELPVGLAGGRDPDPLSALRVGLDRRRLKATMIQ